MQTIRAFIAVELPPPARQALAQLSQTLADRVSPGAVRWVQPEQIHLTLRFFGDTAVERLPSIQVAMDALATESRAFTVYLGELGSFPNWRRPRVVWVGLQGEGGGEPRPLLGLKQRLDDHLAPLGWPPEDKPFRAHLTLGRVKNESGLRGVEWTADVPSLPVPVTAVHLIESQLRPTGPIYTVRHTSPLNP